MLVKYTTLATVLVALGCARQTPSQTKEAPDEYNTINNFQIFKSYSYDDLVKAKQVKLPDVPWTDTYWPFSDQGLASRWTDAFNPNKAVNQEEIKLGAFLARYAAEAVKPQPDPLLSPAEKYDLLFQYRHGLALPADKVQAMSAAISAQDAAIKAQAQIPAKISELQKMYDDFLSKDNRPADQAMSMTVNSWKNFLEGSLDTRNKYLAVLTNPGLDWTWEGHCHGWAAAATMAPPPKHAVMANIGAQQVFFSEGDLRGLMTKAWADAAPSVGSDLFLGRRCYEGDSEKMPIPSNANGRGYSGRLQMTETSPVEPIIVLDTLPDMLPVKLHGRERQLSIYQIRLDNTGERKFLIENVRGAADPDAKADEYWVADAFSDITRALKDPDPLADLQKPFAAQLTGCWDTNPASFHEVLLEQIGQRKIGFVMDRTRTAQVWNQPVYSANFSIGELQPVDSMADIAAKYRASGTAFLAQVHASVSWTEEPDGPELTYDAGYDLDSQTVTEYDYTLEFDAQQRVIGGEWGTFTKIDPAAEVPDFLFTFPNGSVPDDLLDDNKDFENASIDYSGIIAKLHDCSMSDKTDGKLTLLAVDMKYSSCVIDKIAN